MLNKKHMIITVILSLILAAIPVLGADKGSASFKLSSDFRVAGEEIAKGEYKVLWETNGNDPEEAEVIFKSNRKKDTVTVKGKIEQVPNKYDFNSIAIMKDSTGQKVIKQLQFGGKKFRIVFE